MSRSVVLTSRARRDLRKLDAETAPRIVGGLRRFAEAEEGDVAKLRGIDPPEYRLRVGEYRVRFRYGDAGELEVLRVGHRRDVYRR